MCVEDCVASPSSCDVPVVTTTATTTTTANSITFYTSMVGPACRAVQLLLTHLGIPVREVNKSCYIETRTEEFRKINPCHTLPVIDDNGFVLWESRAIMQYLCNKYAPNSHLYPSEPRQRATVERLLNFDVKTLSHAVLSLHFEYTFPTELSATRNEKLRAVYEALTLLEIFLVNGAYVAGEHLTIADISILTSVTLLEVAVEFDLTTYPNIWTWYNRLRAELPYYDPLTKKAHSELRALIQSVRDANDEWSSPMHHCAFVPNKGNDSACIQERKQQYQRLFLKPSDQQDVERIMAAISPVFSNRQQQEADKLGSTTTAAREMPGRSARLSSRGVPYSLHRGGNATQRTSSTSSYSSSVASSPLELEEDKIKRIKLSIKFNDKKVSSQPSSDATTYELLDNLTNIDLQELSTLDHLDAPLFDENVLGNNNNNNNITYQPYGHHQQQQYVSRFSHDGNASVASSADSNATFDYAFAYGHSNNINNSNHNNVSYVQQQQQQEQQQQQQQPQPHWPSMYDHPSQPPPMYPQHGPVSYYPAYVDANQVCSASFPMSTVSPVVTPGQYHASAEPVSAYYNSNNETYCHN